MGRYILAWSALLVGLCAIPVAAQTDDIEFNDLGRGGLHVIQGRLFLPSGRKLDRRVRVRVSGTRSGDNSTLADDNGAFTFRGLTAGTYTLTVEGGREFETATERVDVFDGGRGERMVYTVQIRLKERGGGAAESPAGVVNAAPPTVPEAARERYNRALEASGAGDHKKAVKELKAALEAHPQFPLALNELGAQHMRLGQLSEAADAFAAAVKLAPDEPVLRVNYGILLIRQKKHREAEEHLARAVALDGKNAAARVHHGHALIRLGRAAEAETELQNALKLGGPSVPLAHRYLGALYFERGDDARAAAALEQYLRLAPDAADAPQVRSILAGLKPAKR